MLVRQERVGKVTWLKVEEIVNAGSVVSTRCVSSVRNEEDMDMPIPWAHYSSSGHLLWASDKGVFESYLTSGSEGLMDKLPQPLEDDTKESSKRGIVSLDSRSFMVQEEEKVQRIKGVDIKNEALLSGCNKCPMILSCHFMPQSDAFKVTINEPNEELDTTYTIPHPALDSPFEEKARITIVSMSQPGEDSKVCRSHCVLIQGRHAMAVFLNKDSQSVIKIVHHCITCSFGLSTTCSDIKASRNGAFFSQVSKKRLYVWEPSPDFSELKLVSRAEILRPWRDQQEAKGVVRCELIAVGGDLSIMRVLDGTNDSICIIRTNNGRIVSQLLDWIPRSQEHSLHTTNLSYIISPDAQQWLCDVSSPCPNTLLTVVCRTVSGKLKFILVRKQQHKEREHHHHAHWVQASNYIFQKS